MLKKHTVAAITISFIMSSGLAVSAFYVRNQIPVQTQSSAQADPQPLSSYQVYKSNGSITTLKPSPQHPLIFFATWCSHCQDELGGKTNPEAYYIDTYSKEATIPETFAAIQDFIKTYHTDPDSSRYFTTVDKTPASIPHVPYTITK